MLLSSNLTGCFATVNRMCDDNGCCVTVEQPAESIYFLPNRVASMHGRRLVHPTRSYATSCYMGANYLMGSNALHLLPPAYDQPSLRADPQLLLGGAPQLPPIEYQMTTTAATGNTTSEMRTRSLGNAADRYRIHEATDNSNCDVICLFVRENVVILVARLSTTTTTKMFLSSWRRRRQCCVVVVGRLVVPTSDTVARVATIRRRQG